MTGTSVEGVSEDLSIDANHTVGWCGRNGMVVHTGKTKAMLVSTVQRQPTLNHGKFNLQIGDLYKHRQSTVCYTESVIGIK